jgi:oxygen-dependent protoporphyrinogen oxidase
MGATPAPVAIVGGGLAGLTAASLLRQRGVPFVLYEAGPKLAGLATTFKDADGFSYDFGAHFITNRLAAATGVGAFCRTVRYYGETVWLGGRTYGYPFGLLRNPRYAMGGALAQAARLARGDAPASAAEWFRGRYGRAMADEVALPLIEAWSGARATDLAPSVGDSLPGSILRTVFLKAASRLTGRAVGCGYSREMPETPHVFHVYPEGGVGLLCQKLAAPLLDAVRLDSPVEEILVEDGRTVGVRAGGRVQEAAAVVSTAPMHVLARLVGGTTALAPLKSFRYRPMVFVNMRFRGRPLLPDVVLWTPEGRFPFFRLTETPLSMPWLAPEGKTIVTVDIGCEVGDRYWTMADEELAELCLEHLGAIAPDARARYLGCRALKTPIAYPVYLSAYEADRRRAEQSLGVGGLLSVGRNGEFAHIFMEDVYWRTRAKVRGLAARLSGERTG